jgi:hypothetical protein
MKNRFNIIVLEMKILIKTDYSILVLLPKNNKIMKKIKNFSSWCISKTREICIKAITLLVETLFLLLVNGEVAGIKFKLKRFLKNIDTITLY